MRVGERVWVPCKQGVLGAPELAAEATMSGSSRVLASIFLYDVDQKVEKMYVTKESLKTTFN
jgi:hypothetical protein